MGHSTSNILKTNIQNNTIKTKTSMVLFHFICISIISPRNCLCLWFLIKWWAPYMEILCCVHYCVTEMSSPYRGWHLCCIQQLARIFHPRTSLDLLLSRSPVATMLLNLTVNVLPFLNLSAVFDTDDHSFLPVTVFPWFLRYYSLFPSLVLLLDILHFPKL